jgi:hypothetical protein
MMYSIIGVAEAASPGRGGDTILFWNELTARRQQAKKAASGGVARSEAAGSIDVRIVNRYP